MEKVTPNWVDPDENQQNLNDITRDIFYALDNISPEKECEFEQLFYYSEGKKDNCRRLVLTAKILNESLEITPAK